MEYVEINGKKHRVATKDDVGKLIYYRDFNTDRWMGPLVLEIFETPHSYPYRVKHPNGSNGEWRYAVLAEPEEESESHPSADLLMQLAREAKEDKDFYKNWEVYIFGGWHTPSSVSRLVSCASEDSSRVRKKPKTININGYEVPEPIREEPNYNDVVWVVSVVNDRIQSVQWDGVEIDHQNLNDGLLHTTKEAAEKHREALLSFTKED